MNSHAEPITVAGRLAASAAGLVAALADGESEQRIRSHVAATRASLADLERGLERHEPGPPTSEPWLSKRQAAAHLGVSVRTIERWHHDGLPHTPIYGTNRYRACELDAWATRNAARGRRASPKSSRDPAGESRDDSSA